MDHLGIRDFLVLGFCIGGPFIWNLLTRASDRVVAAVPAQPSGYRPEMPSLSYDNNMKGWGPELCARRPDITMAMVDTFLTNMYRARADFVYTVTRDFVRGCQTPILVLPDDVPAHPYAVAMETVHLAPNAQVSLYPWKDTPDKIPLAVRHIRTFMRAYRPGREREPWPQRPSNAGSDQVNSTRQLEISQPDFALRRASTDARRAHRESQRTLGMSARGSVVHIRKGGDSCTAF